MQWKHCENNVENCINIYFKCLMDLALRMEFSKLFHSLTQKGNKEYWSLLFYKEIPLSCFYLQLKFDNYEHNCQLQVLSEILQRKTLGQGKKLFVSVWPVVKKKSDPGGRKKNIVVLFSSFFYLESIHYVYLKWFISIKTSSWHICSNFKTRDNFFQ